MHEHRFRPLIKAELTFTWPLTTASDTIVISQTTINLIAGAAMYHTKLASVQLVLWRMIEKYHVDPEVFFRQLHLNPELMHQLGEHYSLQQIQQLWEETRSRINASCFGITTATYWHHSDFGTLTLGYAMLASRTLRISLERLLRFHRVITEVNLGKMYDDPRTHSLVFIFKPHESLGSNAAKKDASLAWLMSILRINFQNDLAPVTVHLTHSRPECSHKYYEFFQASVIFNSPDCKLALSLDAVDQTLSSRAVHETGSFFILQELSNCYCPPAKPGGGLPKRN